LGIEITRVIANTITMMTHTGEILHFPFSPLLTGNIISPPEKPFLFFIFLLLFILSDVIIVGFDFV